MPLHPTMQLEPGPVPEVTRSFQLSYRRVLHIIHGARDGVPRATGEFREPRAITRDEASKAFASADTERITDALVGLTFHDPDGRWVQDQCLTLLDYPNDEVIGLAATCLGHVARIHRDLDRDRVLSALGRLRDDPVIGARVQDALDDIGTYLGER